MKLDKSYKKYFYLSMMLSFIYHLPFFQYLLANYLGSSLLHKYNFLYEFFQNSIFHAHLLIVGIVGSNIFLTIWYFGSFLIVFFFYKIVTLGMRIIK
jgi:hypothetical protein